MDVLFPQDSLRLFHRVSLEMAFAYNFLANQHGGTQPVREIIKLDDDDTEMDEGAQGNATPGVTGFGTEVVGPVGQGDAPPILWDVGMDMPAMGEHRRAQRALGRYVAAELGRARWTRLGSLSLAIATEMTSSLAIATCKASEGSSFTFSFESSSKRFSFRLNRSFRREFTTKTSWTHLGSLSLAIATEMTSSLAIATRNPMAVAVDNPMETEPIARETLPPMVKLAMFCATKGEGSTNPKERPKEMSSEGSSTEGGC
ncbi:unnamed protein product [Brassica rapa subsp. trilocularis]